MRKTFCAVLLLCVLSLSACKILVPVPKPVEPGTEKPVPQISKQETPLKKEVLKYDTGEVDGQNMPPNLLLEMSDEERREINIFLSNFSEANYNPNGYSASEAEGKIDFAYIHSRINETDRIYFGSEYNGLSEEDVDRILNRFFGETVAHKTPENSELWLYKDGMFLIPATAWEGHSLFSIAVEAIREENGNIRVWFNNYAHSGVGCCEVIEDKSVYYLTAEQAEAEHIPAGSGVALLREKVYNGENTYELVEYTVYEA